MVGVVPLLVASSTWVRDRNYWITPIGGSSNPGVTMASHLEKLQLDSSCSMPRGIFGFTTNGILGTFGRGAPGAQLLRQFQLGASAADYALALSSSGAARLPRRSASRLHGS